MFDLSEIPAFINQRRSLNKYGKRYDLETRREIRMMRFSKKYPVSFIARKLGMAEATVRRILKE